MERDWSKMLPEMLEMISDRLPLKDFIAFRSVCPQWRLAPSGRTNISKFSRGKPWLMFYGLTGDKCEVYSDSRPSHCTFYLPDLQGATIIESKFGWVIAHRGEHFFLYNCFTLEKINLPDHDLTVDQACTFTTLPTCSDCIVFIVSRMCESELELSSCHIGDTTWEVEKVDCGKDFVGTMRGVHYCCSCSCDYTGRCTCRSKGKIGIYGHERYLSYSYARKEVRFKWRNTYKSNGERSWHEDIHGKKKEYWLQRFGGKRIKILTCAHSRSAGTSVGTGRRGKIYSPDDDDESDDQVIIVKAAAIELNFKEWVSISS